MGEALCGDMDDTECRRRRQAYATLMIASMARTASVLSNPTVNVVIGALTAAGYHDFLEKESISAGVSVSAGGSISSSLGLSSDSGAGAEIGLSLIDASIDLAYLIGMNWYPKTNRFGVQAIQEIQTNLSVLSFSVAGQGLVSADDYFGLDAANNSFSFTEEMIFDSSGNPCEFILTISDGEEIVIYRIDDMARIQQLLATGAANISALAESMAENPGGLQLGLGACSQELTHLFYSLLETPVNYERRAVYKVKNFDYTLSLDFNIQIVTVGGALSVNYEEKRVYAAELGVIESGVRKVIQTYTYDTYVRGDNHSLSDLMSAILDGLWSFVDDAVDWIKQSASSGTTWVIKTLSLGEGTKPSSFALKDAPPAYPWASLSGAAHSLSKTTDISIISYVPPENPIEGLTVIGKCHDFQPGNLVPLLALTLEIGYGFDPLPPRAEPSNLGLYRWNNGEAKWEIVSGAVMDTATAHTATASVMNLGLYSVGADLTSPTVTLLPTASDGFTTSGALLSAFVRDRVSGVDTVLLEIDENPVSSEYDEEDELMTYTPQPPLGQGQHELKITATDNAGNSGVSVWNVTVDDVPPTAQITQPTSGATLKGAVNITGTANDANFDYYLVQMKPKKGSALWWIGLPKRAPVQNGLLLELDSGLLDDGDYALILEVRDKAGNKSRAEVEVTLNNHSHGVLAR
jgi:hypothetical protein